MLSLTSPLLLNHVVLALRVASVVGSISMAAYVLSLPSDSSTFVAVVTFALTRALRGHRRNPELQAIRERAHLRLLGHPAAEPWPCCKCSPESCCCSHHYCCSHCSTLGNGGTPPVFSIDRPVISMQSFADLLLEPPSSLSSRSTMAQS